MIKIAFAGNPNVGKSALINLLSNAKLKVGNWPGVTVEKKEAEFTFEGQKIKLIDLPGVYSLSPYTMEEIITRDYILEEKPDVIVNAIDSTNLDRNLFLTLLLKELGKPIICALNFADEFNKLEYKLDINKFKEYLDVDAVFTSAVSGEGLEELLRTAIEISKNNKNTEHIKYELSFNNLIEKEINKVKEQIKANKSYEKVIEKYPLDYVAIKLIEKDSYFIKKISQDFNLDILDVDENIKKIEKEYDEEVEIVLSEARYAAIKGVLADTFTSSLKNRLDFTNKIDMVLLNRFGGLLIFFVLMSLVFTITFNGSGPFIDWIDGFISNYIGKYVAMFMQGTPDWLNSFVMDGLIGGVGGVLVFVPLMLFLYFFMALLEESGYMSRIAFLMDRLMKKIGLNGKAFVPLILGFGCTVPAIYATRTLEDENSRKLTALMAPFMSCGARLPVYALFTAAFFGKKAGIVVLSLYLLGIFISVLVGLCLKLHPYFKTSQKALLIELPPYRIPRLKVVFKSTIDRTMEYLQKATTVIMAVLVIIWALTYFPGSGNPQKSYLAGIGKVLQPVLKPTGFADRWETVASVIPSIAAKEVVVGFMAQVLIDKDKVKQEKAKQIKTTFGQDTGDQIKAFGIAVKDSFIAAISIDIKGIFTPPSAEEVEEEGKGVIEATRKLWEGDKKAPLKAYSFMVFILLVVPCVATLAAVKQEFGYIMLFTITGVMIIIPYIVSTIIYQLGSLLFF